MKKIHPKSFKFFLKQVALSNQLRWYISSAACIPVFLIYRGSAYLPSVLVLLFLYMGVTYGFARLYRWVGNFPGDQAQPYGYFIAIAFTQGLIDILVLTLSVYVTGGILSPMPLLYIVYLGAVAVFFPVRLLVLLDMAAILMYTALMQGILAGLITPIIPSSVADVYVNAAFVQKTEITYIAAMVLSGVIVAAYSAKIHQGWWQADAQNEYLDHLHLLTRLGLEHHEINDLSETLTRRTCNLLEADTVYLTHWDDKAGQVVVITASDSQKVTHIAIPPIPVDETNMTRSVRRAGRWLVAEDVFCSPYISPRAATQFSTHSLLGLPLYGLPGKRFLGALLVGYNEPHYFDSGEIERALQTADVVALLVSRTSLYKETVRRADMLERLAGQITSLTSDLHQTKLLPAVVEAACSLLHAQRAALNLYDQSTGRLRCEFSLGLSKKYLDGVNNRFEQLPGSQTLQGTPYVLIPDVHRDGRTNPIQDLIAHEKFRAYAVFGLTSPQGAVGTLAIYWDQPYTLTPDEISVAQLFAQRAGALLHSAKLYTQASEESVTDILTGLPNRRALDQRLARETTPSAGSTRPCALLMMDLNGFKAINDAFGHPVGDDVLQQIAAALRKAVRATDFLTRYGGDEFAVVLPETGLDEAVVVAEKLIARLNSTPMRLPGDENRCLSASIGIAIYPFDAQTDTTLLSIADQRLYRAKRAGPGLIVSEN